jgi:hypothetical protein
MEAKACHVTCLAECARLYDAEKSTKCNRGVVVNVHITANASNLRTKTMLIADYSLGGGITKCATLNVRSVRALAGQLEENGSNNAQNELTSEAAGLDNIATVPMTTNINNIATLDPLFELNEDLLMSYKVHEEQRYRLKIL